MKFGGTSVSTADNWATIAELVRKGEEIEVKVGDAIKSFTLAFDDFARDLFVG